MEIILDRELIYKNNGLKIFINKQGELHHLITCLRLALAHADTFQTKTFAQEILNQITDIKFDQGA